GQRRKMLRASLKGLGGETLLEKAGIDPTARAEVIAPADFLRLAGLLQA
ncbi:MAG: 16S rRNA (adenine(1518)-N(6)/adenine(1519)-N(6))-dimethyltransferase, partial [Asticcacaulis sp.]